MMYVSTIVAALVACAAAEVTREPQVFYWNKNNNFETAYNWDDSNGVNCAAGGTGCPDFSSNKVEFKGKVTIPDADACTAENNIWADKVGRVMKIATDIDLSTLVLPTNGKIILGDDITMTIKEEATGDVATAWACKKAAATNFKCGDNWSLEGFDEEAAHEVPCHEDTVVFPDDSRAIQVHIPTATFAKVVKVENPSGASPQFVLSAQSSSGEISTQADVNSYISLTGGQFEGSSININTLGCGRYCDATCTNDCGAEFAAKSNATKTFNIDGKTVVMTDDEWQRQVMHAAAGVKLQEAQKWNAGVEKLQTANKYDKLNARVKLSRAAVVKDWITAELDELNAALPKATYSNGTLYADPAAAMDSLNKALTTLLAAVAPDAQTSGISCKASARTGAISCDGIKGATIFQGKATATLYTIIKAIDVFFGAVDFDDFSVPDAKKLTMDKDVQLDFAFSYADADFRASPYHLSMGGFLNNNMCDAIESSLSYELAMETYNQFSVTPKAVQAKFYEYIKEMVKITSIYEINQLSFCDKDNTDCKIKSPAVLDTSERRARRAAHSAPAVHSFSPANFVLRVELTVPGGMDMFSQEGLASAMAIGMWGSNAMFLQLAKVQSLAEQFSSTTTTTVRTTKAAGEVTLKEADAFKASDVDKTLKTAEQLVNMKAKLEGQVESANAAVKAKADTAAKAKAAKELACAGQLYKTSTCDAAKKLLETALNDYDQAVYDAAKVKAKYDVYAPLADKAKADADAAAKDKAAADKAALDNALEAAERLKAAKAAVAAATEKKAALETDKIAADATKVKASAAVKALQKQQEDAAAANTAASNALEKSKNEYEAACEADSTTPKCLELKAAIVNAETKQEATATKLADLTQALKEAKDADKAAADRVKFLEDALAKAETALEDAKNAQADAEVADAQAQRAASMAKASPADFEKMAKEDAEKAAADVALKQKARDAACAKGPSDECNQAEKDLKIAKAAQEKADAQYARAKAANTTKESDDGFPLIIVIAIAAVVLICLAVVLAVVLMGGSSGAGGKADANRNVVAFENPMYDDPNANTGAAAYGGAATYDQGGDTYGAAAAPDADPGLYDEPAFQAEDKSNPMYSSKDNVAESGNGYLDVAPDEDDDDDDDDDDESEEDEDDDDDDDDDESEEDEDDE